ncbi:hypothetical protein [Simiduia aestuariiviva]|uniref:Uncharacterized protein n=1 Tax=Simiduia aestuariiviva TaxID=1510459 RepID=A0A839UHG4_9GAMM|nr:hypothetical protein [Simiduia aestuariiviva]MBB3166893.1 hypothetical protein [Simiduia aestuariiviva]
MSHLNKAKQQGRAKRAPLFAALHSMKILLAIIASLVSSSALASILFINVTPISFEELEKDHYRFEFINHGLSWLPEPDPPKNVVLHIRYRPECLIDNAINFGQVLDSKVRYANFLDSVSKLREQLGTVKDNLIFGFDAKKLNNGEYATENLRVHTGHMRQSEVVWAVGSNFLRKHCN